MYGQKTTLARTLAVSQALMLIVTLVTMSFPTNAFAVDNNNSEEHKIDICHNGHINTVDEEGWGGHEGHDGDFLIENDEDRARCEDSEDGNDEDTEEDTNEDDGECDEGSNSLLSVVFGDHDDCDSDEDEDEDSLSCTLSASPNPILVGGSTTLTLDIMGEDSDEASATVNYGVGELSDGDTAVVSPSTTTTYTATISEDSEDDYDESYDDYEDDEDTVTCSVIVTVNPVPPPPPSNDSCVVVSDVQTLEGGLPAVLVSPIHSAWTAAIAGASWIWGENPISDAVNPLTETFTRTFSVVGAPTGATLNIAADNSYSVKVNGVAVGADATEFNYSLAGQDVIVIPGANLIAGTNTIEFTVNNFAQAGGTMASNPAGLLYKLTVNGTNCGNPPPVTTATVHAQKVMCQAETDLPNWSGNEITIGANTAANYVAASDGRCELVDWNFQWAPDGTSNPGDNLASAGSPWTTFSSMALLPNADESLFWFREVIPAGYVPFSGDVEAPYNDVSAEFYCGSDVLHYDNYDFVSDVDAGEHLYCVGFNTRVPEEPTCDPKVNLIANGDFEAPDVTNGAGWDVFEVGTSPTLVWLADFLGVAPGGKVEIHGGVSGWLASDGVQYTELDSDLNGPSSPGGASAVEIAQGLTTVNGQKYHVSYDFSARPGTNKEQNGVTVSVNGTPLQTTNAAAATAGNQTEWNTFGFDFTAAGTLTTLALRDAGTPNDSLGTFVDNVKVTCVPEEVEKTGTLVIVKNTTGGDGSFDFDITGNDLLIDADVSTVEGSGSTNLYLSAGNYDVTETVLSGWNLNNVYCVYDNESAGTQIPNGEAISIEAGDTVTCTFSNIKVPSTPSTDVCPNLEGDQASLPSGFEFNNDDQCVEKTSSRNSNHRHGGGGGQVLGASTCGPLLTQYLHKDWKNDPSEVTKLQQFLNDHVGSALPLSGLFDQNTFGAVEQFQTQYGGDVLNPWVGRPDSGITDENTPTGFVYQTTRWKINNLWCPGSEAFPDTLI